jgi:hypothetical protein
VSSPAAARWGVDIISIDHSTHQMMPAFTQVLAEWVRREVVHR